ncbi:MAG: DUF1499 domain-containing protein [Sphingomonadales bacterium]|nr:DUF1499 domain-containing protein [Sphingomonadales bacterium]
MLWRLGLALLLIGILGFAAWVRLAPVRPERWHRVPSTAAQVGDWVEPGGFEAVRQLPKPQAAMTALDAIIMATPRTTRLEGAPEDGLVTYVTRSALWGFPDITNLWIEGGRLHIRGHLIYGRSDLGVNRTRIEGWLVRAGL